MGNNINININNNMGRNKSFSQGKLSAKNSIARKKNTMDIAKKLKTPMKEFDKALGNINSGNSSGVLSSGISKGAKSAAILGMVLATTEKFANFGVNVYEAQTGNSLTAHNTRTMIKTASSLGLNYAYGALNNEIFTKKIVDRQNHALDYGREIYNITTYGSKYKKI